MRKKHIFIMLLMALPMLLLTSCLKNQEDLFQESSSARMENYLNTYEALLKSSEYGWAFEYYAGTENQEYGGWTYDLKFNDKDVDVYSDQALNPTEPLNSLYKLGNDDGPILTFDTYNDLIHLFATPWGSSSGYEAYGGDFEFIIMGVNETKDVITLKGKRSGNIMYLRKLDKSPAEFMANVIEMEESITLTNFIGSGLGANLDYDYHSIFIGPEEQYDRFVGYDVTMTEEEIMQYTRAFLMTENGIRLYEPVEYNGVKIQSFIYDIEARTFTCTDEGATNITLGVFIPEGYNEWAGDYYITCSPRLGGVYTPSRIPVSIEPEGDGFTLNLKGLNKLKVEDRHVEITIEEDAPSTDSAESKTIEDVNDDTSAESKTIEDANDDTSAESKVANNALSDDSQREQERMAVMKAKLKGYSDAIFNFGEKFPNIFSLFGLVLLSGFLYIFFRRCPAIPDLRYSEFLVALVYISNMYTMYCMALDFLCIDYGLLTLALALTMVPLKQLSGFKWWRLIFNIIMASILMAVALFVVLAAAYLVLTHVVLRQYYM